MSRNSRLLSVGIIFGIFFAAEISSELYFGINQPTQLFIAVLCEPGPDPKSTEYADQFWTELSFLIHNVDQWNVKLNILFSPQWVRYILESEFLPRIVHSWEENGHEIGLYVCGPHMDNWCGYTNQVEFQNDSNFIGSIDDMMALMNQIPANGKIMTTHSLTGEDIKYDYPSDVLYSTMGGTDKLNLIRSKPKDITVNSQNPTSSTHISIQVTHARFCILPEEYNINLNEFKELYTKRHREYVMGLVFQIIDWATYFVSYEQLFAYLNWYDIITWRISDILT